MVSKKNIDKMTFEQALEELDNNVQKMDKGNISLKESFELFKRGIELSEQCSIKLDIIEKEVDKIVEKPDNNYTLERFMED